MEWKKNDRVEVFWEEEQCWFSGSIQQIDEQNETYRIAYDDGDEEWEMKRLLRPKLPAEMENMKKEEFYSSDEDDYCEESFESVTNSSFHSEKRNATNYNIEEMEESRLILPRPYMTTHGSGHQVELTARPYFPATTTLGSIVTPKEYIPSVVHSFMECTRIQLPTGQNEVQTQTIPE